MEQRYKCHQCKLIFLVDVQNEDETDTIIHCPECGESSPQVVLRMCPNDHIACHHDIASGIAYCDLCGEPICPICGSHDVAQISRVTGYMSNVDSWNAGKRQELHDRARYDANMQLINDYWKRQKELDFHG
jgi:DNA-directed RNA polymerase subunit RPC12/RpoP